MIFFLHVAWCLFWLLCAITAEVWIVWYAEKIKQKNLEDDQTISDIEL